MHDQLLLSSQINPNLPDWIPQFTAYFWNLNYYTTSPFDFLIQKYYVFFVFSHFYHKAFTDFTLFLHRSAYIFLMRKFYISFVHNRIVKRRIDLGMAKQFLKLFDRHSFLDSHGSHGSAEFMRMNVVHM